eukprot:COSAG01_NODE_5153_length_4449_cov_8.565287_5_plen_94_part_00
MSCTPTSTMPGSTGGAASAPGDPSTTFFTIAGRSSACSQAKQEGAQRCTSACMPSAQAQQRRRRRRHPAIGEPAPRSSESPQGLAGWLAGGIS